MAHVLEMRSKLMLPHDDYRTVQQIYRGWSRLGFMVVAALAATRPPRRCSGSGHDPPAPR
jgi:hypothetical protein